MNDSDHIKLLRLLHTIPEDQRENFIQPALRLIESGMLHCNIIRLLRLLYTIPEDQRANFIEEALRLTTPDMDNANRRRVVNEFINTHPNATRFVLSRTDFQQTPKAVLLDYAKKLLEQSYGQIPLIVYKGEKGMDAEGLTRDFITNIFREIYSNFEVFNTKSIDDQGVLIHLDNKQDSEISKAIGIILGATLINQTFSIGKGFHPVLFHMLKVLDQEDFQHIPDNIQSIADLNKLLHKESSGKVFTKLFDKYIEIIYPEGLAGMNHKEFLETYPEPHQVIRSIALIAKHMYNYLVKHDNGWDAVANISHETLSKRLEGEISKQLLKTSIQSNNENLTALINNWVDSVNDDQLKKFLLCATGSLALLPEQKLVMELVSNHEQSFIFHTCSMTIEVSIDPNQLPTQEEFNDHLNTSINMPDEFQIV